MSSSPPPLPTPMSARPVGFKLDLLFIVYIVYTVQFMAIGQALIKNIYIHKSVINSSAHYIAMVIYSYVVAECVV